MGFIYIYNKQQVIVTVLVERRVARKEDMMTSMGWLVKVFMMFTVISTAYSYYDR